MWLIAGLGNPGSRYERTPHNLGYEVADTLVRRHGLRWEDSRRFKSFAAAGSFNGEKIYFLKPITYMNLSGDAVQPFADFYKIPPANVLVACDDVNLPYGRIRLRERGSDGGQKGLRNIIQRLGTDAFCRLRIGCAPERPVGDLAGYVLSPIWGEGVELARLAVEAAADCIEDVLAKGPQKTMSVWNAWSARPEDDPRAKAQ
ncbi:MAG: peptidyl-tRNA hydrolase, family [Candidatus Sumerlaeota bacterium]|nr:peptidyl-tRNA hydrolase, family [Candidatus Sumerlaeota bacterium]